MYYCILIFDLKVLPETGEIRAVKAKVRRDRYDWCGSLPLMETNLHSLADDLRLLLHSLALLATSSLHNIQLFGDHAPSEVVYW